jgi:hypothetical protein
MRISLEAVGKNDKLAAPDARPVEVEEVIVGRIYPFSLINNAIDPSRHRRIEGLEVPVVEQERRAV